MDASYRNYQPSYMHQTATIYSQASISRSENTSCNLSSRFSQDKFVMEKPNNVILEDIDDNIPIFYDVLFSQDEYFSPIQLWIE